MEEVKKAAVEWLKNQHAERLAALNAPGRGNESPREKAVRSYADAAVRREIALIDFICDVVAGLP